jgi:hypothetical protein
MGGLACASRAMSVTVALTCMPGGDGYGGGEYLRRRQPRTSICGVGSQERRGPTAGADQDTQPERGVRCIWKRTVVGP